LIGNSEISLQASNNLTMNDRSNEFAFLDSKAQNERLFYIKTIEALDMIAMGQNVDTTLISPELIEDPLDAHLLYVRWTLDTLAPHEESLKKCLITTLEQSTRRFVHEKRYFDDLRYLKLWVLYARQCSKAGAIKIYEYLNSKTIGIEFSMLYEEWANAIEQDQADPQKVEQIFDLGIQREAQPLTRLKKKKLLVLKRMSETKLLAQETTSGQTQNLQSKLSDS
ncbi:hypothetical protein O181_120326, partial [Austropuccinia psidii MF-1]|nr:hypothetical protein [Austropuccinia psidii MF-1]